MVFDVVQVEHGNWVQTEPSRDSRHTEFGKVTLSDRVLLPGESFHDRFARLPACPRATAARRRLRRGRTTVSAPAVHAGDADTGATAAPATASPASSIGGTRALAGRRGGGPRHLA